MFGVAKVYITESELTLKTLLDRQTTTRGKERVQALYLLKSGQVETIRKVAMELGRDRTTVQRWLRLYRQAGIEGLLQVKTGSGQSSPIS